MKIFTSSTWNGHYPVGTAYGLAGGGMGAYTICNVCGKITGKSVDPQDSEDEDNESK